MGEWEWGPLRELVVLKDPDEVRPELSRLVVDDPARLSSLLALCVSSPVPATASLSLLVWDVVQSLCTSVVVLEAVSDPASHDWPGLLSKASCAESAYCVQALMAYLRPAVCVDAWESQLAPSQWFMNFVKSVPICACVCAPSHTRVTRCVCACACVSLGVRCGALRVMCERVTTLSTVRGRDIADFSRATAGACVRVIAACVLKAGPTTVPLADMLPTDIMSGLVSWIWRQLGWHVQPLKDRLALHTGECSPVTSPRNKKRGRSTSVTAEAGTRARKCVCSASLRITTHFPFLCLQTC